MLEREKDAKPNNYTAKWRAMREVGKAVATGFFFLMFCIGLMSTLLYVGVRVFLSSTYKFFG